MNLREHLQQIYDEHGRLTPELVVETASDPDHPLYGRFEWLDAEAAHQHRLDQARGLIRQVRVTYRNSSGEQRSTRSYHSFRAPEGGYSYVPTEKVVESPMLTRILLADMRRDWLALKRRYESFEEFAEMIKGDLAA